MAMRITDLFEKNVNRFPGDHIAFVASASKTIVTYGQLNEQANQLARYLLKFFDLSDHPPIAILCQDRQKFLVSMLAVLKSGSPYVPVSTEYPTEKVKTILDDIGSQTPLIMDIKSTSHCELSHSNILHLDMNSSQIVLESTGNLSDGGQDNVSNELAYIIFTSGSTGKPKGVMVSHDSLIHVTKWFLTTFDCQTDNRTSVFLNPAFDASVAETWPVLLSGGTLVQVPEELRLNTENFLNWVIHQKISTCFLPTAVGEQFLDACRNRLEEVGRLRHLFLGGEPLSSYPHPDLPFDVINNYGPTETTVQATCLNLNGYIPSSSGHAPPIGKPITGVNIYILDKNMKPVPPGETGEIYIGGVGVAKGYWNQPQLTREKFVSNPLGQEEGALAGKLYRSGDLASWLPDGNILFKGRADEQVKLRGYRFELGEVKSVLQGFPGVSQAVVMLCGAEEGGPKSSQRLVAFVVPKMSELEAGQGAKVQQHQLIENVCEDVYAGIDGNTEQASFFGWNSSFTGEPIPVEQMQEWVAETVETVLRLHPQKVLEIGAGSGLIFDQVASKVVHYTATDLSGHAVATLKRRAEEIFQFDERHAKFIQREADVYNLDKEAEIYDTVIINSVIQYFPDPQYLLRVLEGAVGCTQPGGRVFIGDIRSKSLLPYFHTAVQLGKVGEHMSAQEFGTFVQNCVIGETELAVDPMFFRIFAAKSGRIGRIQVELKKGRHMNELNCFRYNVILHLNNLEADHAPFETVQWKNDLNVEKIIQEAIGPIVFANIPNRRVYLAHRVSEICQRGFDEEDKQSILKKVLEIDDYPAVDPHYFVQLAEKNGRAVQLLPSEFKPELFHAVFAPEGGTECLLTLDQLEGGSKEQLMEKALMTFATDPMRWRLRTEVIQELREFSEQHLPSYMVPTTFHLLEEIPLTANGKVDKSRLAPLVKTSVLPVDICPQQLSREMSQGEKLIANAWAKTLQIPFCLIHPASNFFHLGGNSLVCSQVVSYLKQDKEKGANLQISVGDVFRNPVLQDFAAAIFENSTEPELPVDEFEGGVAKYPLTRAQEQIWLHLQQSPPDVPLYNEVIYISFSRPAIISNLNECLNAVVQRHSMLRTNFKMEGGIPVAFLNPAHFSDNVQISEIESSHEEHFMVSVSKSIFDLENDPLINFFGVKAIDGTFSKLYIVFHHLIMDGHSLVNVFLPELGGYYKKLECGSTDIKTEPNNSQMDKHANWERNSYEKSVEFRESEEFWRKYLDNWTPLELNVDRMRPKVNSYQGMQHTVKLSPELSQQLGEFSGSHRTTSYITLLSALKLLLFRHTGQHDISICGISTGRRLQSAEGLIGHFANLFALRNTIKEEWTFPQMLQSVHENTMAVYQHQFFPFQRVLENTKRNSSCQSLSPVVFCMDPYAESISLNELGWQCRQPDFDLGVSKFDLLLRIEDTGSQFVCHFQFNTDVLNLDTIQRFSKQYEFLLERLTRSYSTPPEISRVEILPKEERNLVLHTWNQTEREFSKDKLLIQSFLEQVQRSPKNIAISDGDLQLTYKQLNKRVTMLANILHSRGVSRNQFVAILLPRSVDYVVSVMAILKVGGVYVPLNEEYTESRINYILEDTQANCLVMRQSERTKMTTIRCSKIVLIDQVEFGVNGVFPEDSVEISINSEPESLACVIYTSGSTGTPKGVMLTQRGIQSFCEWHMSTGPVVPSDRSTMLVSPAFDVCIFEMFPYLFSGASLHICPEQCRYDPKYLLKWLKDTEITLTYLPTALSELFLRIDLRKFNGIQLRKLYTAGEKLTFFVEKEFPFDVINCYAPTEATVQTTAKSLRGTDRLSPLPSIGGPTFNCKVYVLDKWLEPVPVGVVGELFIGGEGVSAGYLNKPELTRQKYLVNPFNGGCRKMYRTGDLVRWLPNGEIDFKCRMDDQVKIRGYRIELGEIEVAVGACPKVQAAVVVVHEQDNSKQLVCHVIPKDSNGNSDLRRELINFLKKTLPPYMIPSAWVFHQSFPLTPNGKTDKKALPSPNEINCAGEEMGAETGEYELSEIERKLAGVWSDILNMPHNRIEVFDNFFEIGGHSLLAVQLIEKIKQEFGIKIHYRTLFSSPTLRDLGAALETAVGINKGKLIPASNIVILHQGIEERTKLFFIHPVGGTLFCYQPLVRHLVTMGCAETTIFGIQDPAVNSEDGQFPFNSLEEMAANYAELIKSVQPEGQIKLMGHSFGGLLSFEIARQLGAKVESICLLDPPQYYGGEREKMMDKDIELLVDKEENLKREQYKKNNLPNYEHWVQLGSHRFQMALKYKFRVLCPIKCKLFIVSAKDSDRVWPIDPKSFWDQFGLSDVHFVAGDHYSILEEPHVQNVSNIVRCCFYGDGGECENSVEKAMESKRRLGKRNSFTEILVNPLYSNCAANKIDAKIYIQSL